MPNFVSDSDVFAAREIMLALLATAGTFAISARFATGKCGWVAGAMTAAIAAISTTRPFSGNSMHRLLFVFCMLGAALSYAIVAFVSSGDVNAIGFGACPSVTLVCSALTGGFPSSKATYLSALNKSA